ncbi:MAG: hypothetical protein AB1689_00900 [Thermodesulfobacteriota bacterium]
MRVREVVVCSALAAGLSCLPSAPAGAATIVVTERKDVSADDGRCSLREAVDAANTGTPSGATPGECVAGDAPPAVDVIRLRRAKYVLSLGAPGDDANREGDLDLTESVVIEGKGAGKTKVIARFGDPAIPGDGDRLFHVDPAAAGGVDVTFTGLTSARATSAATAPAARREPAPSRRTATAHSSSRAATSPTTRRPASALAAATRGTVRRSARRPAAG